MGNPVPSLSASGWIYGIMEKADKLAAYYFTSDHSQSTLFANQIASLQYQIQQFGHSPFDLRRAMSTTLKTLLDKYFDGSEVEIDTETPLASDPNRIHVTVKITVIENDERYSFGRLIEAANGKVVSIVNLNNTGT